MKSYNIIDVEGVGEKYCQLLESVGVHTTFDLLCNSVGALNYRLNKNISIKLLKKWRSMCQLTLLEGLDTQHAEGLVREGVTSLAILRHRNAGSICKLLEEASLKAIISSVPQHKEVEAWIHVASLIEITTTVFGQVKDTSGKEISDAQVTIGDKSIKSNNQGAFVVTNISPWDRELNVEAAGYYTLNMPFDPRLKQQTLRVALVPSENGHKSFIYVDASKNGHVTLSKGDTVVRQNVELADLEEGTPLVVYHYGRYNDGKIRFATPLKIREGKKVIIRRIKIPEANVEIDDPTFVYEVKNGKVVPTSKSKDDFWKSLFKTRYNLDIDAIIGEKSYD